jgi:uncharacterized protein YutE (UPF0331/DUF86 family)
MINNEIIRKIYLLQEYHEKVLAYTKIPIDEIFNNEEKQSAMERYFLLMVDETIDINAGLIYQLGGRIPESSKNAFFELVSLGIIDRDFANIISESIRIRNELVHDYEKRQKLDVVNDMIKFIEIYNKYIKILVEKFVKLNG